MTRLIDANALKNLLSRKVDLAISFEPHSKVIHIQDLENAITNAPTIEANSGEAVAWALMSLKGKPHKLSMTKESCLKKQSAWLKEWPNNGSYIAPLYTSQQKREWVELTDEQIGELWLMASKVVPYCDKYKHFYKAIQAKLKEVNHG